MFNMFLIDKNFNKNLRKPLNFNKNEYLILNRLKILISSKLCLFIKTKYTSILIFSFVVYFRRHFQSRKYAQSFYLKLFKEIHFTSFECNEGEVITIYFNLREFEIPD